MEGGLRCRCCDGEGLKFPLPEFNWSTFKRVVLWVHRKSFGAFFPSLPDFPPTLLELLDYTPDLASRHAETTTHRVEGHLPALTQKPAQSVLRVV